MLSEQEVTVLLAGGGVAAGAAAFTYYVSCNPDARTRFQVQIRTLREMRENIKLRIKDLSNYFLSRYDGNMNEEQSGLLRSLKNLVFALSPAAIVKWANENKRIKDILVGMSESWDTFQITDKLGVTMTGTAAAVSVIVSLAFVMEARSSLKQTKALVEDADDLLAYLSAHIERTERSANEIIADLRRPLEVVLPMLDQINGRLDDLDGDIQTLKEIGERVEKKRLRLQKLAKDRENEAVERAALGLGLAALTGGLWNAVGAAGKVAFTGSTVAMACATASKYFESRECEEVVKRIRVGTANVQQVEEIARKTREFLSELIFQVDALMRDVKNNEEPSVDADVPRALYGAPGAWTHGNGQARR